MKPRCLKLHRKWSKANSVARDKVQNRNANIADVQSKPMKKRGVYVEKKTSNPITSSLIPAGVKFRRINLAGQKAEDKLNLIESALDILAKMPVADFPNTTKSDTPEVTAYDGPEGSAKKPKTQTFKSSAIRKQQEVCPIVVIQPKKNMPDLSSTVFSHESSNAVMARMETLEKAGRITAPTQHENSELRSSMATTISRSKIDTSTESPVQPAKDTAVKTTIERMIENMAMEDRLSSKTEDRPVSPVKKELPTSHPASEQPVVTQTLVNKFKKSKKSDMSLYDFFVDLCKNKMNYESKPQHVHGRRGRDDVSFTSVTDVELAPVVNDIAQSSLALSPGSSDSDIDIPIQKSNLKLNQNRPSQRNYRELAKPRRDESTNLRRGAPPLTWQRHELPLHRSEPLNRAPIQTSRFPKQTPAPPPKTNKNDYANTRCLCPNCLHTSFDLKDRFRIERLYNMNGPGKKSGKKGSKEPFKCHKKNALLSTLREQLTVNYVDVTNEPQNVYQALQKLLKSQRKAEKYRAMETRIKSAPVGSDDLKFFSRSNKKKQEAAVDNVEPFNHDVINSTYYDFY